MESIDQIAYQSGLVTVGLFRCPPSDPRFENTGPISETLLVFPRTSVRITHWGRDPVIASPNVVMYYNRGQCYDRGVVSEVGDICEWFTFDRRLLVRALGRYDRARQECWERPFDFTHGPSDAISYLLQRMVVEHLLRCQDPDTLFIEETLLAVLDRVLARAIDFWQAGRRRPGRRIKEPHPAHVDLARQVTLLLSTRFQDQISLAGLAEELHYSRYHLARVFRQQTGFTVHRYLAQVRLRTALEQVAGSRKDLTEVALDVGYSSHSHFTESFRQVFGFPPSQLRRYTPDRLLQQLS